MMRRAVGVVCIVGLCCVAGAVAQLEAAAEDVKVVGNWQQCGGLSCPGFREGCADAPWTSAKCGDGLKCERESEYFWQCRAVAKLYQQCGGQSCGARGPCGDRAWAACLEGTCVRRNEWYWQCSKPQEGAGGKAKKATKASLASAGSKKGGKKKAQQPATAVTVAAVPAAAQPADTQVAASSAELRVAALEQWAARVRGNQAA